MLCEVFVKSLMHESLNTEAPCNGDRSLKVHLQRAQSHSSFPHPLLYARVHPSRSQHLPCHLVWSITFSQAESAAEVADEHGLLLDVCQQCLVNGLLVCGAAA
jgi:hypothetical protein